MTASEVAKQTKLTVYDAARMLRGFAMRKIAVCKNPRDTMSRYYALTALGMRIRGRSVMEFPRFDGHFSVSEGEAFGRFQRLLRRLRAVAPCAPVAPGFGEGFYVVARKRENKVNVLVSRHSILNCRRLTPR